MKEALKEAENAKDLGEVPIGCIIVKNDEIIGRGHNLTETEKDPTAHAEIIAIRQAAKFLGGWRLPDTTMYVTCEPCAMCAGAIVWARIGKVVIGTMDPKAGAAGSVFNILEEEKLNHHAEVVVGVMADECKALMQDFFRELRTKKLEDTSL